MTFCPRAGCGKSACPVRREGCGNGVMVRLMRHRQTKEAVTDRPGLRPPRHIFTLPSAEVQQPITQRTAYGAIAEVNNALNHDSNGPQSAEADVPHSTGTHMSDVIRLYKSAYVSVGFRPTLDPAFILHEFTWYRSIDVTYRCCLYLIYRKPATSTCPKFVTPTSDCSFVADGMNYYSVGT